MNQAVVQRARDVLAQPQRQSPLAVVFMIIRALRGLGIGTIIVAALFVINAPVPGGAVAAIPMVILFALGVGVLSWWRYTFVVVGDELGVTKGILKVQRLTVPLDRVQSVSIDQEFLHRPVNLVRASVDTAGSSDAEFTIDAISRPVAEALQTLAAENVSSRQFAELGSVDSDGMPPPPEVADEVLLRHSPGRLVKIALAQSPWAGLAFLAPLIALGDDIRGAAGDVLGVEFPSFFDDEAEFGIWIVWVVLGFFVIATLLSLLLQVVRELTSNWQLTLTKTATGLRRTAGLISTSTKASSLSKIQRVSSAQTPVQRWLGLQNLRLPTIGAGDLVIPGVDDGQLETVRSLLFEPHERIPLPIRRISPLAIFLAVRNTALLGIVLAAAMFSPLGYWALAVLLIVPLAGLAARRRVRLYRWDISRFSLVEHSQFYARNVHELALRKTQSVKIGQSFFERRRDLATVSIATAEGSISVGMIPLETARAVRDRAIYTAETDQRRWM